MARLTEIEAIVKPVVDGLGYELWGIEYLAQGKHSLLRIYIDNEAGITLDDCQRVSEQVSATLDVEEPLSGHYSLEISSPGIPRPLFTVEQMARYVGEAMRLKLHRPIAGKRKIVGQLQKINDELATLLIDDEVLDIPVVDIEKASLA